MNEAVVKIKNLRLRAVIGINPDELDKPQDIVVNLEMAYDAAAACASDRIADALDYKAVKQRVIAAVEAHPCGLLETLAGRLLDLVLADPLVRRAKVEIDKPHALRFADSVSVTMEKSARPGAEPA